jgi:hypothetical protein
MNQCKLLSAISVLPRDATSKKDTWEHEMGAEHLRSFPGTFGQTKTGDNVLPHRVDQDLKIDADLKFNNSSVRPEDLADVARQLKWTVEARNVMVFPADAGSPTTRVEVEISDPSALHATADALADAVQTRGFVLRLAYEPRMPANEIWLTFPENDGSCVLTWFGQRFKALS